MNLHRLDSEFPIPHSAPHHAMNHDGFMISPELHVVQDRVQGSPEPRWIQGQSPELNVVQGEL